MMGQSMKNSTLNDYQEELKWIQSQQQYMEDLLIQWANINSGSRNLEGLERVLKVIDQSFSTLPVEKELIHLKDDQRVNRLGEIEKIPLGKCLRYRKISDSPIRLVFAGHMDTVFPKDSPFQTCSVNENMLHGPGVADLKGGLVILLHALHAFERSPWAKEISYDIVINPDEEIGSPGSAPILRESAKGKDLGIIVEPSLPDGSFASARKGSAVYVAVAHGKPAHVGREYHLGRNAVVLMSEFIQRLDKLNNMEDGITVNAGYIEGGGAVNVVPERAVCRFNIRSPNPEKAEASKKAFNEIAESLNERDGFSFKITEEFARPPKIFDAKTEALFGDIRSCADLLGQKTSWNPTGGVCDGNILASVGVPTIDTMGAIGGGIHTHDEFMLLDSLSQRASLMALYLMRLARGELKIPTL